jgi:hypothetical protein
MEFCCYHSSSGEEIMIETELTRRKVIRVISFMILCLGLELLSGCGKNGEMNVDDLNAGKNDFLGRVFAGELADGPFFLNYSLSTVFLSKDVVSVFGEFTRYTNFPHDSKRYEGKTFCKVNQKFKLISFNDLFYKEEQKEFIRKYCEDALRNGFVGYFGESPPLREHLDLKDIQTFLIHEDFLVIVFQRYVVAGLDDYPTILKIPYADLKGHIHQNPLIPLLEKMVASRSFISIWENVWGPTGIAGQSQAIQPF